MRDEIRSINHFIRISLQMVFFLLIGGVLILTAELEHQVYPIVRDFKIEEAHATEDGRLLISGTMNKKRSCVPLSVSVWETDVVSGLMTPVVTDFSPTDYQDKYSTDIIIRPEGFQSWGPWSLSLRMELGKEISVISEHRCHPLWNTETILTRVSISELLPDLVEVEP